MTINAIDETEAPPIGWQRYLSPVEIESGETEVVIPIPNDGTRRWRIQLIDLVSGDDNLGLTARFTVGGVPVSSANSHRSAGYYNKSSSNGVTDYITLLNTYINLSQAVGAGPSGATLNGVINISQLTDSARPSLAACEAQFESNLGGIGGSFTSSFSGHRESGEENDGIALYMGGVSGFASGTYVIEKYVE